MRFSVRASLLSLLLLQQTRALRTRQQPTLRSLRRAAPSSTKAASASEEVDSEVGVYMGEVIRVLPNNVINAYKTVAEKITIRLSLLSLTIHVMMLIPFLNSYKKMLLAIDHTLGAADSSAVGAAVSVVPFLYISPIIILLPFLYYYLWENDIDLYYKIPSNLFDIKLKEFIASQKVYAVDKLKDESDAILSAVYNDGVLDNDRDRGDDDKAYMTKMRKNFAYLQVLSMVDVEVLFNECVNAKIYQKKGVVTNNKAYNNKVFSSFNGRTTNSSTSSYIGGINDLLNSEIIVRSQAQSTSAFSLVEAAEEISRRSNASDKQQLISQLRDFQVALNEVSDNNEAAGSDDNEGVGRTSFDESVLKLGIKFLDNIQKMLRK